MSEKLQAGYTRDELRSLIQSSGGCGEVSDDGSQVCIKEPEHEGPHGWETVEFESAGDLLHKIYELLFHALQGDPENESPRAFAGLQGDKIVVMQAGGKHFSVVVLPAYINRSDRPSSGSLDGND